MKIVIFNAFFFNAFFVFLALICTLPLNARSADTSRPHAFKLEGDVEFTHDPSIIKDRDTWYVFSTANGPDRNGELPIRCSKDLKEWKHCGYVFDSIPDWIKKESPNTRELWAPDISYFDGRFHLYYAFSVFGKNTSGIALLTNKTLNPASPDFHWEDQGLVLESHAEDDFNAIDPNLSIDAEGHTWLAFGSFWSGIKMRRIDRKTGKLSTEDTKLYSLASRKRPGNPPPNPPGLPGNWQAIEAPFLIHHDGYYYLFVSFDLCCRGTKSTYKTMVGRSRNITGPYVDENGVPMLQGGGTALLVGNDRWVGPGGESVLQSKHGDIIVFHAYDGKTGRAFLQISSIACNKGWPHAALEGTRSQKISSRRLHFSSACPGAVSSPGLNSFITCCCF
ncbi:MAG: arabinan endo-1,5-alpha-L-arabinosidase [Terriglobales bacterium]